MAYYDESGMPQLGNDPRISQWQSQGLDPSYMNTSYTPASQSGEYGTYHPATSTTSYNGPGGKFTQIGGEWVGSGGQRISDLGGYINMRQQQQSGANFQPYQNQLNQLLANPSSITQTPGYQFALQQGNEAINRSAAAKGMLNSGNVLAELAKYGQGMASQGYQQQLNNLQGLMQGAQQFGVQTGYYQPPQNAGFAPGPFGTMVKQSPSTW